MRALPADDIEARLSILEDDLDQLRNETRHARVEVRGNSQRLARLERIVQDKRINQRFRTTNCSTSR